VRIAQGDDRAIEQVRGCGHDARWHGAAIGQVEQFTAEVGEPRRHRGGEGPRPVALRAIRRDHDHEVL